MLATREDAETAQPAPVLLLLCKRLASSDPRLRTKAYMAIKRLLARNATSNARNSDLWSRASLLAVWKALHYMLWMQDQPLLQEEVVERLTALLHVVQADNVAARWKLARTFWATESREWHTLDFWRTDKFLLLVRRMLATCLKLLSAANWADQEVAQFKDGIVEELICSELKGHVGLRMHLADVLVEELSDAHAPTAVVHSLLAPYVELMGRLRHDEAEFAAVKQRVFEQLVDQAYYLAERQQLTEEAQQNSGHDLPSLLEVNVLQVDYGQLADSLFEVGSREEVSGPTRRKIFELVRIYRLVKVGGQLPDDIEALAEAESSSKALGLKPKDIRAAVNRLEQADAAYRRRNKRKKQSDALSAKSGVVEVKKKRRKKQPKRAEQLSNSPTSTTSTAAAPQDEAHQKDSGQAHEAASTVASRARPQPSITMKAKKQNPSAEATSCLPQEPETAFSLPPASTALLPCVGNSKSSPRTKSALPRRRVSFGKIYRKPFKKKDIVCTPSSTHSDKCVEPGRSILKAKDRVAAAVTVTSMGSRRQRRKAARTGKKERL